MGCTPVLREACHLTWLLHSAGILVSNLPKWSLSEYCSLGLKIKDFSWGCWILLKVKPQDLYWFCFLMWGEVLLVKAKKRNWCWKKKTEKDKSPECFMFPCGLATCLPYQNRVAVWCPAHEVFRHPSDRFILPEQTFYLDFFPLHPVMPSKVCVQ